MAAHFIFLFKKSLILGLEYSLCELGLWKEKHFSSFIQVGWGFPLKAREAPWQVWVEILSNWMDP